MLKMTKQLDEVIRHFLETGESAMLPTKWAGDWLTSARLADQAMRDALIVETKRRAQGKEIPNIELRDWVSLVRAKVTPMVNGLFPKVERANVLGMLEQSMVVLTTENIDEHIRSVSFRSSARDLANLYLTNIDAETFGGDSARHVGLNEGTRFYLSYAYFEKHEKFADWIVHEAAHAFHNCRRSTVGLPEIRSREHLLKITFAERETFAYACEVYSRILELADCAEDRIRLAEESEREFVPPDEQVNVEKFRLAVREAAKARNGWKVILKICSD